MNAYLRLIHHKTSHFQSNFMNSLKPTLLLITGISFGVLIFPTHFYKLRPKLEKYSNNCTNTAFQSKIAKRSKLSNLDKDNTTYGSCGSWSWSALESPLSPGVSRFTPRDHLYPQGTSGNITQIPAPFLCCTVMGYFQFLTKATPLPIPAFTQAISPT